MPRKAPSALKHGLTSRAVVLPEESTTLYDAFSSLWLSELEPEGALEHFLAHRIVAAAWRLARIESLEGALRSDTLGEILGRAEVRAARAEEEPVRRGGRGGWKPSRQDLYGKLAVLGRHESSIERVFYRALGELRELQAPRRSRPKPAPGFGTFPPLAIPPVEPSGAA